MADPFFDQLKKMLSVTEVIRMGSNAYTTSVW